MAWITVTAYGILSNVSGIATINSQNDATQILVAGTGGTDFAISSAAGVHTFNIPSASLTARGLVTTTNQSFDGKKTFANHVIQLVPMVDKSEAIFTPLTGETITLAHQDGVAIINPAGSLLALTITFASTSLEDGQLLTLTFRQAVTSLTLNGGTIIVPLTSAAIGSFATYRYNASDTTWDRVG